jgi:hypothetical protein
MSSDLCIAKEEVKEKTSQPKKVGNEQPLRELRELNKSAKVHGDAVQCLDQATLEPDPIEDRRG